MNAIKQLQKRLKVFEERAHAPFSGRREVAAVLLGDGQWVPGVRVESASYPLVIPATLNAVTTALSLGRRDIMAVVSNRSFTAAEKAFWDGSGFGSFHQEDDDCLVGGRLDSIQLDENPLTPFLESTDSTSLRGAEGDAAISSGLAANPEEIASPSARNDYTLKTSEEGIQQARAIAERAHIPESNFPVGCILVAEDGRSIPGVNVEHSDWSSILCAERNALSTAVTFGVENLSTLYLSCPLIDSGTPCGACRQLLLELAPGITVWMDRGALPPERKTPEELLPGAFLMSDSL